MADIVERLKAEFVEDVRISRSIIFDPGLVTEAIAEITTLRSQLAEVGEGKWPNHVLGTYGPMTVERTVSGPKLGYVLTVRCGGERVEIRASPKGRSGMSVEHVLYSSEGP